MTPSIIKLTTKEKQIVTLLYRYRFLSRFHIQTMLGHQHHSRVLEWLNDLLLDKLIIQDYDHKLIPEPAIYTLDNKGKRYLKKLAEIQISYHKNLSAKILTWVIFFDIIR